MEVKMHGGTEYANIYRVYDENGKVAGTVTLYIAGRYCGMVVVNSWSSYGKREIRKAWTSWRKSN